jgi:hypothetical protein
MMADTDRAKLAAHEAYARTCINNDGSNEYCNMCLVPFPTAAGGHLPGFTQCNVDHIDNVKNPCRNVVACGRPWCTPEQAPRCVVCKKLTCLDTCRICDARICYQCVRKCVDCGMSMCHEESHLFNGRCTACDAHDVNAAERTINHLKKRHPVMSAEDCVQCNAEEGCTLQQVYDDARETERKKHKK